MDRYQTINSGRSREERRGAGGKGKSIKRNIRQSMNKNWITEKGEEEKRRRGEQKNTRTEEHENRRTEEGEGAPPAGWQPTAARTRRGGALPAGPRGRGAPWS